MISPQAARWQLFSGTHEGIIHQWDLRMNKILKEITSSHLKKYDECIQSLALVEDQHMLLSGGADGVIKVFQY